MFVNGSLALPAYSRLQDIRQVNVSIRFYAGFGNRDRVTWTGQQRAARSKPDRSPGAADTAGRGSYTGTGDTCRGVGKKQA
jgi:hypothetical protein